MRVVVAASVAAIVLDAFALVVAIVVVVGGGAGVGAAVGVAGSGAGGTVVVVVVDVGRVCVGGSQRGHPASAPPPPSPQAPGSHPEVANPYRPPRFGLLLS